MVKQLKSCYGRLQLEKGIELDYDVNVSFFGHSKDHGIAKNGNMRKRLYGNGGKKDENLEYGKTKFNSARQMSSAIILKRESETT